MLWWRILDNYDLELNYDPKTSMAIITERELRIENQRLRFQWRWITPEQPQPMKTYL